MTNQIMNNMEKYKLSPVDKMLLNNEQMNLSELFKAYGIKQKKNIKFSVFGVHFYISY